MEIPEEVTKLQQLCSLLGGYYREREPSICFFQRDINALLKLPRWIHLLNSMVKISLHGSQLEDDALRTLGTLPKLIQLKLLLYAFIGQTLCFGAEEFPSLKG